MSLLEYIILTEKDELWNFKSDILEILEFFQSSTKILESKLTELNSKGPSCVWDDNNCIYKTSVITIHPKFTNIQDELARILMTYLEENRSKWEEKFTQKKWFEFKPENILFLRTDKLICHFCVRVLLRELNGEPIEKAIENELELLFQIKYPITLRRQQVVLQNVALIDDKILEFEEQTLKIEGQDLRWHEDDKAKSCKIENFELKFKIYIRRMTPYEFDYLTSRKGFYAQQMNISTYLEIIYEYPNEHLPRSISDSHWKSKLAYSNVELFLNKIIINVARALRLSSGKQLFPVKFFPEYYNFYEKKIIPKGFPMIKKNYLFYFFTDNIKFTPERFKIVSEIFDILVDTDKNLKVGQILNIFDRADEALQHGLTLLALVMYWIMIETVLDGNYKYRARQASWLYGIQSKKYLEEEFWMTVSSIRNKYVHGDTIEKIRESIKNFNKKIKKVTKENVGKNIPSLTLIAREKAFRIFLFLLLFNKYSAKGISVFHPNKRIKFHDPPVYNFKSKFNDWVQKGTEKELGLFDKYTPRMGTRMVWV